MTQEFVTLPREVLERALNALNLAYDGKCRLDTIPNATDALRAALDQPRVEQSSVVGVIGWKNHLPNSGTVVHWTALMPPLGTKLYTHPQPKREPLIGEAECQCPYPKANPSTYNAWLDGWEAAERAHGIK